MNPSEPIIEEFENVSAIASIYELKLRLLADKTPALKDRSHARRLEDLEDAFIAHFEGKLTDQGVTLLRTGRQLRNKVLHGDFSVAAEKVEELKPGALKKGGVVAIDLREGTSRPVSGTDSRDTGIFGWLLECKASGLFDQCRDIFAKMIGIVARSVTTKRNSLRIYERNNPEPFGTGCIHVFHETYPVLDSSLGVIDKCDQRFAFGVVGVSDNVVRQFFPKLHVSQSTSRVLDLNPDLFRLKQKINAG